MRAYAAKPASWEKRLIPGIRNGDEGAFRELFRRFQGNVYGTALRILKEEQAARDALQETFVNIHRACHKFRGDSKLSTWINRIAINVCLETIRRNRKHRRNLDGDVSEWVHLEDVSQRTPFEELRRTEIRRRVLAGISALNEHHRKVVWLHDLEGFTIREIAKSLKVAEGTIKSRLFYGRRQLRQRLEAA